MSNLTTDPRPTAARPDNPSGPTADDGAPVSAWNATKLVAEREISTQVRTKSFVISTIITLVLILGGIIASSIFGPSAGDEPEPVDVAVVGDASEIVAGAATLTPVPADDVEAAQELVRSGEVEAAVVADADAPSGVRVIALEEAPADVVQALSVSPEVEILEPSDTSDNLRFLIGAAFGFVFMITAIGSGAMIVQNTVQEKQSRVVEILLAAVPARSLMAGKVLGNSVIGVGNAAAMAAVAALGLAVTGQGALLDLLSAPLIWFVIFFLFGFVLIAGIFAGGASLVSRQEDTGSVMTPAMMLIMLPYFGVVFLSDNPVGMAVMSYVPFTAPVAMPVRLFFGEAAWWEPLVSLGVLALATFVVITLASKIYTNSLLRMGSRVPLREALRGGA
ncbi:ABC transporter permease [Litorihabitans aurantiacus]|uniref:ABC transporter permease n=1 Tax=Litorihabitans aurantiacus TaxID=1930061 RepID=A0AA37XFV1_9MICO|nr:ABC transporter permease [Litorihabitans aurantiacus]GMA32211.1 ABC transporter permease [Litorihabitans aurantiacus]